MAQVVLISKPNVDVFEAYEKDQNSSFAWVEDFYLDSRYPLLKVHAYGTFSFNIALEETTINHNLGYKPFALAFGTLLTDSGGSPVVSTDLYQMDWFVDGATTNYEGTCKIYSDKIVIRITNSNVAAGATVSGFYYIFKDET